VVYRINSRGPKDRTLRDTTYTGMTGTEVIITLNSRKERDDKYDLNPSKAEPWMPNQDDRRVSSILRSMVSKAAERSRRQRRYFLWAYSINKMIVNVQQSSFSGVVMLNVSRLFGIKEISGSKVFSKSRFTTRSMILDTRERLEMGR